MKGSVNLSSGERVGTGEFDVERGDAARGKAKVKEELEVSGLAELRSSKSMRRRLTFFVPELD